MSGGGLDRHVIKTTIKTKPNVEKTTRDDATKFSNAFAHASSLSGASTGNIKNIFQSLELSQLQSMDAFLKKDKTPNGKKFAALASYIPAVAEMEETMLKLSLAVSDAKHLLVSYLEESGGDGNGGIRTSKVQKMIETKIAVAEELKARAQSAGDGSEPVAVPRAFVVNASTDADVAMRGWLCRLNCI